MIFIVLLRTPDPGWVSGVLITTVQLRADSDSGLRYRRDQPSWGTLLAAALKVNPLSISQK